jgi:hypothetical protein
MVKVMPANPARLTVALVLPAVPVAARGHAAQDKI